MKTIIIDKLVLKYLIVTISFLAYIPLFSQDKEARLKMNFKEDNGEKYITATAFDVSSDSADMPIEEIDLYFFVERTFSDLPIGDRFNTTDEVGEVTIEFPSDLPGDREGSVNVIVKILESDDYKDTEIRESIDWGIPLVIDDSSNKRTLWSAGANAPVSLLIIVNLLIAIAWGLIFYFAYKIYLISKM